MAEGWIYILTNPNCPPDLLRIGATNQSPEEAAQELSRTTHLPTPFEVGFRVKVQNTDRAEKLVHKILDKYHLQHDVGFFKVSLENAIQMVEEATSYFKIDKEPEKPTEFIKAIRKQAPEDGGRQAPLEKIRCRGCDREFYIQGKQELSGVSCPYCREPVGTNENTETPAAEKEPIKDIDKLLGEVKPSARKPDSKPQTITIRPAVPAVQPEILVKKPANLRPRRIWVALLILLVALAVALFVFMPSWISPKDPASQTSGRSGPELPAPPEPPSPVEPSSETGNTAADKTTLAAVQPGNASTGEAAVSAAAGTSAEPAPPAIDNPQTVTALVFKDAAVHMILAKPTNENTMYYRLPAGELADADPAGLTAAVLGNGDIVPLRDTGRNNKQLYFRIDQESLAKNGSLKIKTVILNGGSVIPCEEAWIRNNILYYEHNQGVIGLPVDSVDVVYFRSANGAVGVPVKVDGLMRLVAQKRAATGVRP